MSEMTINSSKYRYRFLARVTMEAKTPVAIGSGEKDFISDSLVITDMYGLPYIPGTTVAGVVRSIVDPSQKDILFGFQKGEDGRGSEIVFTEAKILNSKGEVMDGIDISLQDELCTKCMTLPIRQHVRINGKGTAADKGKFDEQVVFAGVRFCFEFEIVSKDNNTENFTKIISAINNAEFRLGSGSRSGFGQMEIVDVKQATIDMTKDDQLEDYLNKSSNLQESKMWRGWKPISINDPKVSQESVVYHLELTPDDFFMFGSGFGDDSGNADMTGVRATKVVWDKSDHAAIKENCVLIPASSLKGALRHRVAYYYNKKKQAWAGSGKEQEADKNDAVIALFGKSDGKDIVRGNALFSDIIKEESSVTTKYINHVSIDRFTGGAIDGALFTELADYGNKEKFTTVIVVKRSALKDGDIKFAFEKALDDLKNGMLPLGGGVNRGNGIFRGNWTQS